MSIIQGNAHTSAGGGGGYQIERSLRFNSADSAYLNRTFASAGNRTTWTWSAWVKRSFLDATATSAAFQTLFHAGVYTTVAFSADKIYFQMADGAGGAWYIQTSQVFRDPSAWYHIVAVLNTPSATASQRMRLYINGVEVTAFSTDQRSSITQSTTSGEINNNISHAIGGNTTPARYFSGYQTEVNFIDGQALTPASFGRNNIDTGVWEPLAYTGTYGTNGFYLNFSDNSGTTSTTLGKDSSGNGNNWTPNNFSVTAGAGNDSLVDSPTSYGTDTGVGGEVRGNYATYNSAGSAPSVTLSNGNLDASHGAFSSTTGAASTFGVSSGKWYWEVTINAISSGAPYIGIVRSDQLYPFTTLFANNSQGYAYRSNGQKRNNSTDTAYGASYTSGDVIGVALDMDAGTIVFYKNNSSQGTAFSSLSGTFIPIDANGTSGGTYTSTINFGQRAFAYTAPSGFKALCTQNLPTPTIGATSTTQADNYFSPVLYTGTGSTRSITSLEFQPDFTWIKPRSAADYNILYDAVRGVRKQLYTSLTNAEETETQGLSAFLSNGFTLGGAHTVRGQTNDNGVTYVAWNWKANGAGSSNTAGTITSTVSANTTSGFSIVTYTGNFTASQTVGHGLSTAPVFIITKRRDSTSDWGCIHPSLAATQIIRFNLTGAAETNDWFANTRPTSSVFYVGQNSNTNPSGGTMVAYVFAPVAGYSTFGSYTGNAAADGPFIYTGFRPRFVIRKCSSATSNWFINDAARNPSNVVLLRLNADLSDAESSGANSDIDFLSNGFKIRATSTAGVNQSGQTHIYMAFAESPFKFSLAR